jgi:hypothetical protein
MKKILLVMLLLSAMLCGVNAMETNTVKILTIGNSFADNACSMLRNITKSVPGCKIVIGQANIGGCYLKKHAKLIKDCEADSSLKPYYKKYSLKDRLKKYKWDVVTIQQVSYQSFKPESYQPYADQIIAFVKTNAPQAEIVIHQTWAYSPSCKRLADWKLSRDDMHSGLTKCYTDLSEHYDGMRILPSGNAMYESYKEFPEINLWNSDGYHANHNGCYLTGCVWFGELFGVSPEKVTWSPEGMDLEVAKNLRKVAAEVLVQATAK